MTRNVGVLLLFAAIAVAFWGHRVYLLNPPAATRFGYEDVFFHAFPTAAFLHRELRRGHLPLWNPHQMAGQPFQALYVTAALYPPNLLLMGALPPARALEALALLHLTVAGCFTWLFAARLGLSPPARLAATVGYMLAPSQVQGLYMVPCLATLSWLPAILWALHGLLSEPRARWAVRLAVCFTLAFLGGYAVGIYYAALLGTAYFVFGLFALTPRGARGRALAWATAAAVLAFGLAAPQLFPTVELTGRAVRTTEAFTYAEGYRGSLPEWALVRGVLGGTHDGPMYRLAMLPGLALPLALCGLLARRLRAHWGFLLITAAVAGSFMLGPRTPVYAVFYALPLGRAFRGPWQMAAVYQLAAALLAGVGIEAIRDRVRRTPVGGRVAAALAVVLALAFAAAVYGRAALPAVLPAVVGDAHGAPPGLIAALRAAPHAGRLFVENQRQAGLVHKIGMQHGLFVLPDYESNLPAVYQRFLTASAYHPWQGSLSFVADPRSHAARPRLRALDLMSVRYYATPEPDAPAVVEALARVAGPAIARGPGWALFERREALPRAYVVERVVPVADAQAALARVLDPTFSPREEAVVTGAGIELTPEPPGAGVRPAEIVRYTADEVEVAAECPRACLLVLTDLAYPGWRARTDGREARIVVTNGLFRGVPLAPGAHRVTFAFRPASFRAGVVVLAVVVVGAGLLAVRR